MEPELKIYTIADLRSWLIDNNPPAGLSEHVIAPVRAYAILNNPYVREDDAVVAAIYVGDELAAYTAAFPDLLTTTGVADDCGAVENSKNINVQLTSQLTEINVQERIWWATTLWCNPKYQGHGYGMIVIGSLMEAHEPDLTFDRWGAHETVEIFKCLGYHTTFYNRHILGDKSIDRSSFKGKLAYCVQELQKFIHHTPSTIHRTPSTVHRPPYTLHHTPYTVHYTPYTLKYSTFIDGEAYAFMQAHRGNDLFLREQKMLNWILQYPFAQPCPLRDRVEKDTMFTSNTSDFAYLVVKVYKENINVQLTSQLTEINVLKGVYILRKKADSLSVIALYFEEDARDLVFRSIVDHVVAMGKRSFETEDKELKEFVQSRIFFPRCTAEPVSFSIPEVVELPDGYTLQFMDGDSFC